MNSLSVTPLDYSSASEGWADFFHNQEFLLHEIKLLLLTSGLISEEEFDVLFEQAIIDMHQDDYNSGGSFLRTRKEHRKTMSDSLVPSITCVSPKEEAVVLPQLISLLQDTVANGASAGFLPPLTTENAQQ